MDFRYFMIRTWDRSVYARDSTRAYIGEYFRYLRETFKVRAIRAQRSAGSMVSRMSGNIQCTEGIPVLVLKICTCVKYLANVFLICIKYEEFSGVEICEFRKLYLRNVLYFGAIFSENKNQAETESRI